MTKRQISRRSLAPIVMFVAAVFVWGIAPAGASIVTFYGADNGVVPGGARPNSDNAAALFDLAAGGSPGIITFEGLLVGNFTSLGVATGVIATIANGDTGFCAGICNLDEHSPTPLGYNTTAGGTQHLRVVPGFNSATGETVTFAFTDPINAFGAYLTDTQTGFPGIITLTFSDGAVQTLSIPSKTNNTGGVLFFGFTDTAGLVASVSFNTGTTGATRDIWGIDDVHYARPTRPAPEPATLGLLGLGLAGLAASRRRRAT